MFHLPHGEMSITLQNVEVIYGLPIEGEVLVGLTTVVDGNWSQLCMELVLLWRMTTNFGGAKNSHQLPC